MHLRGAKSPNFNATEAGRTEQAERFFRPIVKQADGSVGGVVEHSVVNDEAVGRIKIGDGVCPQIAVDAADDQHVVEISSASRVDVEKVSRFEGHQRPVDLVERVRNCDVIILCIRKEADEFCTIIRDEWIQQPKIVRHNVLVEQSCIAQDRDGKRPAGVAGIAVA